MLADRYMFDKIKNELMLCNLLMVYYYLINYFLLLSINTCCIVNLLSNKNISLSKSCIII